MPVLMLGGHVAALPERTLAEEACDFVAARRRAVHVVDLLEALRGDRRARTWRRCAASSIATTAAPSRNPAAPLVTDLDREMPGVAWDLLPMAQLPRAQLALLRRPASAQPYAALYTTLGCPYHCSFCCIQAPFKSGEQAAGLKDDVNSYRFWSPTRVVEEIDMLVNKYGVRNIKFADEMFVLNQRHVLGICDRIIERGYDLNIWAYARVDTVKDGMLDKLKRAGFNWLALGIEAADDRVLTDVDKRLRGRRGLRRPSSKIKAAGINVIGNYIFGLPEDTLETMQETLDLALDLNCEFANFYSAMAYPGSPLYDAGACSRGWRAAGELERLLAARRRHAAAADAASARPARCCASATTRSTCTTRISRYLDMVREKFGDDTVAHIREMTSHRLERQHALKGRSVPMDVSCPYLRRRRRHARGARVGEAARRARIRATSFADAEPNLRDRCRRSIEFFARTRPEFVFVAAGKVVRDCRQSAVARRSDDRQPAGRHARDPAAWESQAPASCCISPARACIRKRAPQPFTSRRCGRAQSSRRATPTRWPSSPA